MSVFPKLILTASGIRGIAGEGLTFDFVRKLCFAFGSWLNENEDKQSIAIGRDTRLSGEEFEKAAIEGLARAGCTIINFSICPTPVIIFAKNARNLPAGVIISGSHNPPEWNGLKLLHEFTFIGNQELDGILEKYQAISSSDFEKTDINEYGKIKRINPIPDYLNSLFNYLDKNNIINQNTLKVAVDTGAGAGKLVTPSLLRELGCKVISINEDLIDGQFFPRDLEPIAQNLHDLIITVLTEKCDIGFAHDCDADRLAVISNDGRCFPEDIGLAIIAKYYLKKFKDVPNKVFVTNLASSLVFDLIAEENEAKIIRTPVGERYLAVKMKELDEKESSQNQLILGGEGSCGGIMYPAFNNARDGIFAAAKLIEILIQTKKTILELALELPTFHSHRENIIMQNVEITRLIAELKKELLQEGENVIQIGLDLRFGVEKEWFVLIHPSNTEPVIRVIAEAKRESLARIYCETTAELLKMINSRLL